jgi:hypothetical protein
MKRLAALAALAFWLVPSLAFAEPNDGSVTGQLVNRTNGGGSPAGSTVQLFAFGRKEQAPLGQQTTSADDTGHYAFTALDRNPNIVYLVIARYANVNYPSETPFQLVEQPEMQNNVNVYDSTTADDALQIERLNLLVLGADQGSVQFMQMGAIVNNGDRTFLSPNPQDQALARAVKFPLPRGAIGAQMESGFTQQDVIPGLGGIQVTTPLLPGRHEFAMSFQLPYNGSSADLSMQMPYPTSTFNVYLPNTSGLRLDASSLNPSGPMTLGGQQYSLYTASNLAKATIVPSNLNGLGTAPGGLGPLQLALISLGVVWFILGGGVVLLGGRTRPAVAAAADSAALEQERLELIVRIAALDERFAAGHVKQADYELERVRGKQRLRELLLLQRQQSQAS